MHLLADFIKNAKYNDIHIDSSSFINIPYNLYCISPQGKIIDCNKSEVETFGFSQQKDILGLSAYDMAPEAIASLYHANNQEVLTKKISKISIEPVSSSNLEQISYLSYKIPFRNLTKKNIGIIGLSIPLHKEKEIARKFVVSSRILDHQNCHQKSDLPSISTASLPYSAHSLTKRQTECLHYLALGMTLKQIARALHLSPKTIEYHLEVVKSKLGCFTRYELIQMALKFNI